MLGVIVDKALIARLDPGSFTTFVGSLLMAEAGRIGMPPTALVMSDAITEADEGLDAVLDDVPPTVLIPTSAFPEGLVGLQLKATKKKAPSTFKLGKELRKKGPKRIISTGGTYILVSPQDLNPAQNSALKEALASEAKKVVEEASLTHEPKTRLWDAQTLAGLCAVHPAPAIEIGLVDFGSALTLDELLEMLRAEQRPFQPDPARDEAIAQLRERAQSDVDSPLLMVVHGYPGVGKTRLVAHALDIDELADQVLYVNGAEDLQVLLTRLLRNTTSRGILFIDEVDQHDVAEVGKRLGGLGGRWRVVSVTSRTDQRWIPSGPSSIVLPRLSADATRKLVEAHSSLAESKARMVAEVADGFPELAFRLAEDLRADPTLDLVRLSRQPGPAELLSRALRDEATRLHLAPISLFTGVGFDADVRYQLEEVAQVFELDVARLEHHCDNELDMGRFVARAGRYRHISPLLVAIWLATELIERTPNFADRINRLSTPLQEAFIQQLDYFGPDVPHLPAALARVLEDDRFRKPRHFDQAAGRLLRASAAIVPAQVASAISELLEASDSEQLHSLPRRDLVWALEVLLWWPETWEQAIEGLYRLAQHENESWANNATAQFAQAFSLLLSGTTVPYQARADWLEAQLRKANPDELELLASAAAAGLKSHHIRTVTGFPGGGEPQDWQPSNQDEFVEARRRAWELLLAVHDQSPETTAQAITKKIADAIRVAYGSGLDREVEGGLTRRRWSVHERAMLASSVRHLLRYDRDVPGATRAEVEALHEALLGTDLDERLHVILETSIWDLYLDRKRIHEPPSALVDLADQVVSEDRLELVLGIRDQLEQQDTRFRLIRLISERLGAERVGQTALAEYDWVALAAALSVGDDLGEKTWVTSVLKQVSLQEPERVPELLNSVALEPHRVDLALHLVEMGKAPGLALSGLLYGAQVAALGSDLALRVISTVAEAGNVEAALGMLDQWLDEHEERPDELRALAKRLALKGVEQGRGSMNDFYVQRLAETGVLGGEALADVWVARMTHRTGLVEELDEKLTKLALAADPEAMASQIFDVVRDGVGESAAFGLYSATDLALLSRLAKSTAPEAVWAELEHWHERELRWALHHMDWKGMEPEPLVRRFLLSDRLGEVANEASVCFFNTLGPVWGPYHQALERELDRARSWHQHLIGTSAEEWARDLLRRYEADIRWHREREEEEAMRLR